MKRNQLIQILEEELVHLWSEFHTAARTNLVCELNPMNERNGWSIGMLNLADRIGTITHAVGSPEWEQIPVDLLLDGWWEAVHARVGLETPPFDSERAQQVRERSA